MTASMSVNAFVNIATDKNEVDIAIAELRGPGFWSPFTNIRLVKLASRLSDLGLTDEAVAYVLRESWSIVDSEYVE